MQWNGPYHLQLEGQRIQVRFQAWVPRYRLNDWPWTRDNSSGSRYWTCVLVILVCNIPTTTPPSRTKLLLVAEVDKSVAFQSCAGEWAGNPIQTKLSLYYSTGTSESNDWVSVNLNWVSVNLNYTLSYEWPKLKLEPIEGYNGGISPPHCSGSGCT